MTRKQLGGPQYINAYLNGMQFVLLALEGRLSEQEEPSKEDLLEALYEYHELAHRMRQRNKLGVEP